MPASTGTITPEEIRNRLTVRKRVSGEARAGGIISATITVTNDTNAAFEDILVDDRFDANLLIVQDEGGGVATRSGIQWLIQNLGPDETWSAVYTARVNDRLSSGDHILSTVSIFGEQLLDVPTSALSQSHDLVIAGKSVFVPQAQAAETPYTVALPQTGVEMGTSIAMLFQILIGAIIAIAIYGMGVQFVWRRFV